MLECVVMARPAAGRWTFTMTERGQSAGTCGTEYSRSQQTVARMPGLYVATVAVHAVICRSSVAVPGRRRSGSSSARAESSWMMACIPGSAASVDHVHRCSRRSGSQHDHPSPEMPAEGSAVGASAPPGTSVPWAAMVVGPSSPWTCRRYVAVQPLSVPDSVSASVERRRVTRHPSSCPVPERNSGTCERSDSTTVSGCTARSNQVRSMALLPSSPRTIRRGHRGCPWSRKDRFGIRCIRSLLRHSLFMGESHGLHPLFPFPGHALAALGV